MSGSIETKLRDRDVQERQRRVSISPSALPAFNPEATPLDPHISLEQWVLQVAGAENLGVLPNAIARPIVVIDALEYVLTLREKEALFAYGLWAEDGNFINIKRYMEIGLNSQINSLIDPVIDNAKLATEPKDKKGLGDLAEKVVKLERLLRGMEPLFFKHDQGRVQAKAIAKEIFKLDAEGESVQRISAMKVAIREKTRLKPQGRA